MIPRPSRAAVWGLGAVLAVGLAQRLWNAYAVPPLTGYDAPGHAGYMLAILETGRLPHPLSGWSTFHPPLYYLLGAGLWSQLEPLGPRAVLTGVRALGALAGVGAAGAAGALLLRLGYGAAVASIAVALVLFVPASQLAGAMVGNEALAAGLAALALAASVRLHLDPRSPRWALGAGALAGLAMAVKYTGALTAVACAVPFLRAAGAGGAERRVAGAATLCGVGLLLLAAPTYGRNLALTGTPVPVTHRLEPMRSAEASLVLRPRAPADFVSFPPGAVWRPSLYHVEGRPGSFANRNPSMASVWGLTYASAWFDPFGHRTSVRDHRDGAWLGPALALLGLVPTALLLAGFADALRAAARSRLAAPDAPLAVAAVAGVAAYVGIALAHPSAAALKCSYLLGFALPAAVFFARGAALLPVAARAAALGVSGTAALAAGLIFTSGLLYPPQRMGLHTWRRLALQLPDSHILEAIQRLTAGW